MPWIYGSELAAAITVDSFRLFLEGLVVSENAAAVMSVEQAKELFNKKQIVVGMRTENIEKPKPCMCCGESVSEYHDVGNLETPACFCTICALDVTK